jgi:hypothetical protein
MANLQHLHCWPFLLIHVLSLPPLAYKRRPGHPIPPHTSSQAIFLSFSSPTVQRISIHSTCQFCPAATPPVHSLVPDDLATKMLPIFSSRCSHMSPTTYPRITARGFETQPGSHSSWLLPHVCTHSVHMTEILILFILYSDIFSMHRSHRSVFSDVLIISAGAFADFGHDATRNVIGMRAASLRPCSDLTLRYPTQVIFNLLHLVNLVFHIHIIIPI